MEAPPLPSFEEEKSGLNLGCTKKNYSRPKLFTGRRFPLLDLKTTSPSLKEISSFLSL